jgi:hypothetical protein
MIGVGYGRLRDGRSDALVEAAQDRSTARWHHQRWRARGRTSRRGAHPRPTRGVAHRVARHRHVLQPARPVEAQALRRALSSLRARALSREGTARQHGAGPCAAQVPQQDALARVPRARRRAREAPRRPHRSGDPRGHPHRRQRGRGERAQYEADLARRRYLQVDPANRHVAYALETDWNAKLREVDDAERRAAAPPARTTLTEAQRGSLATLASDFGRPWADPQTPDRERKRL